MALKPIYVFRSFGAWNLEDLIDMPVRDPFVIREMKPLVLFY